MSDTTLRIVPPGTGRDAYLPLLRLADDSESEIRGYYQAGICTSSTTMTLGRSA